MAAELYPYQKEAARTLAKALGRYGAALDASDTGTGKTYTAAGLAQSAGKGVAVICPKSVIPVWERVLDGFGVEPVFVLNHEKLRAGNTRWLTRRGAKKTKIAWDPGIKDNTIFIWDEVHRCKTNGTANSKMLKAAAPMLNLLLSATAAESVLDLQVIGQMLGLHPGGRDFQDWALQHGCTKGAFALLELSRSQTTVDSGLLQVHNSIFSAAPPRGVRIRSDSIPGFPANNVIAQPWDFGDAGDIAGVYAKMRAEMVAELGELAVRKLDDSPEEIPFVYQLRARQETELLKVPLLIDRAEELMEDGKSVVLFVNFNATMDALLLRLSKHNPCVIRGDQKVQERQGHVDRFQENSTRLALVNVQAGGSSISLHDVHRTHPRASLISPTFNATDLLQVYGRVHRNGGTNVTQYLAYAAGTIEERVVTVALEKIKRIHLLNNGPGVVYPTHTSPKLDMNSEEPVSLPSPYPDVQGLIEVLRDVDPNEPDHAKHGPSGLKMEERCPQFKNQESTNVVQVKGTNLHKALETDDESHIVDLEDVPLYHKIRAAVRSILRKEGAGKPPATDRKEIKLYLDLGDGVTTFGTADRLAIFAANDFRHGVMLDYKFGYWAVDPAEENTQAQAYVLGIFQRFPQLRTVSAYFLLARREEITYHTYTRADVPRIIARLRKIIDDAENPNSPYKPGDALCEFCVKSTNGACPKFLSKAITVAKRYDDTLEIPEFIHGSQISDPNVLSKLLCLAPALEKAVAGWRQQAKLLIEAGVTVPGFAQKLRGGARGITSPQAAWEAVKHVLTPEEFAACADISVPSLLEAYGKKFPKGQWTKHRELLEDSMTDAGILERGASTLTLSRSHSSPQKQTAEITTLN